MGLKKTWIFEPWCQQRGHVCYCRPEAEVQQLMSLHDKISGLPKTSADFTRLRDQLFYLCLVVFLRSMHAYMSAIEPALTGSKFMFNVCKDRTVWHCLLHLVPAISRLWFACDTRRYISLFWLIDSFDCPQTAFLASRAVWMQSVCRTWLTWVLHFVWQSS